MNIVVIGGGFVGQLFQWAVPEARLFDSQAQPPLDHLETRRGPQYLWAPIPGIQYECFKVLTLVDGELPNPTSILAYKRKIKKEHDGGDWGRQFQPEMPGYHSLLPKPRVDYGQQIRMIDLPGQSLGMQDGTVIKYDILINTIPLPKFLRMLIVGPAYHGQFHCDPIHMTVYKGRHLDGAILLDYNSKSNDPVYRSTFRNGETFVESLIEIPGSRKIFPGKIHPHPDSGLILDHLAMFDCYCFGRFATWRPDELAHESWIDMMEWREERLGVSDGGPITAHA